MEVTKKEVEQLLGRKVLSYRVIKSYRGYKVSKIKIIAIPEQDSKEITITLKPKN